MVKKSHKKWKVIIPILIILITLRLILPFVVLHYANKTLSSMHGYYGHVSDVDLAIYRGAYVVKGFYIDKVDTSNSQRVPFISSQAIDLSVEWKSLFHGRVVGELAFRNPVLRFTKDQAEPGAVQKDTNDFRKVLKSFMPLQINRFEINNGTIQFIDEGSNPKIDISMTNTEVMAENLSNVVENQDLLSTVVASANVYKGSLNFKMKLNALADDPTFDLNAELKDTDLTDLNDFLKAYAKFDVQSGTFGLYTEVAAKDGKFLGYVKPFISNLDVVGDEDRKDSFFNKIYEAIVGAARVVLKNQKEEQIATKVPIEGEFGDTTVGTWHAIVEVLRNAFIQALYPTIDNEITILSVEKAAKEEEKGFFKKLFRKSDPKNN